MNHSATYQAWRQLSGLSRGALVLSAAAILVVLWMAPSLLSAIFARSLRADESGGGGESPEAIAYAENVNANREFAALRSPFFEPAAPPREFTPPPPRESGPVTPSRASVYGGPKLVGIVGNQAMFASPVYNNEPFIAVGQKGVVELVSIEQPWMARVRWSGGEFDLNLFDRLEQLPVVNFGAPGAGASPDIFGSGTAPAATTFNLEVSGDSADDAADN